MLPKLSAVLPVSSDQAYMELAICCDLLSMQHVTLLRNRLSSSVLTHTDLCGSLSHLLACNIWMWLVALEM